MTNAELTKALATRLGVSQKKARTLLDAYVDAIKHQLDRKNTVVLRNFGTFSVKEVAAKHSYVPAKKSLCLIPAHSKLNFKAAKKLRNDISEGVADE
ncbi:MAG: HU family DNA-binding protein [Pseudomonadota bacterium]